MFSVILLTLFGCLLYVAYFWKINWIRDLRDEAGKTHAGYMRHKNRQLGKLPPVYPNGWFAVLESRELKKGQVKHVSALGENFAVFRTEAGDVNILDAYCPHLGANMAEGGQVKGDCLECPFHLWTFRGKNGVCDNIPYSRKVPPNAKVKAWDSCEVNEIIFVWYHAESQSPDWRPRPHPHIADKTWRFHGRNEFLISCHIQDIAENGADISHLDAVHGRAIFFTKNVTWLAEHSWTNAAWKPSCTSSEMEQNSETEENETRTETKENGCYINGGTSTKAKHIATMQLRHSLVLFEKYSILGLNVSVEQIGPGYVQLHLDTTLGSVYILQTVTPVEPLLQRVTHMIFSPPIISPYASLIFLGECLMFERDVRIWNHKRFERQPILVREDRLILAYRRWYAQFYSAHSPTYQTATKSLRW